MPDPNLSAAIKEAYASAPTNQVIYYTLEIHHASFTVPIRIVRGKQAIQARLESSAPRGAGNMQLFTALAFDMVPPDQSMSSLPVCKLQLDNVDRSIGAALDGAVMAGGIIEVIYRAYLSDALNIGPETDPAVRMTLHTVSLDAFKITGIAGFQDMLNKTFPYGDYDLDRFPGLAS